MSVSFLVPFLVDDRAFGAGSAEAPDFPKGFRNVGADEAPTGYAGADELDAAWVCGGNSTGFMGDIAGGLGVTFGLFIFGCGSLIVVCVPFCVICRFASFTT